MGPDNEAFWSEWGREQRQRRMSERTTEKYRAVLEALDRWAGGRDVLALKPAEAAAFLAEINAGKTASSAMTYFSAVRRMYNFAESEDLIKRSPMARMKAPVNPDPVIEIPPKDVIRAILAACEADRKGAPSSRTGFTKFAALRDESMIRVCCEPGGLRCSEITDLPLAGLMLDRDLITVTGKGGKTRTIPLSATTGRLTSRYMRARNATVAAGVPVVYPGKFGPMTRTGFRLALARRCAEAGVAAIHPHQLRHYAAAQFFGKGGTEREAMYLFGWDDPMMPKRYAAAVAAEQAIARAKGYASGDEL